VYVNRWASDDAHLLWGLSASVVLQHYQWPPGLARQGHASLALLLPHLPAMRIGILSVHAGVMPQRSIAQDLTS